MKNTLMGTETVPMEGFHLVQKLYSFLDIPGRSHGHLQSTALGKGSKEGSEVRAAPRRKISDLGFLSDQLQCVEINTVRRFGHTGSRSITKRVRLVSSLLVFRNLGWGFSTYGV